MTEKMILLNDYIIVSSFADADWVAFFVSKSVSSSIPSDCEAANKTISMIHIEISVESKNIAYKYKLSYFTKNIEFPLGDDPDFYSKFDKYFSINPGESISPCCELIYDNPNYLEQLKNFMPKKSKFSDIIEAGLQLVRNYEENLRPCYYSIEYNQTDFLEKLSNFIYDIYAVNGAADDLFIFYTVTVSVI